MSIREKARIAYSAWDSATTSSRRAYLLWTTPALALFALAMLVLQQWVLGVVGLLAAAIGLHGLRRR